jgi:hypothetical protein
MKKYGYRIARIAAEIRNKNLLNTSLERYLRTSLFDMFRCVLLCVQETRIQISALRSAILSEDSREFCQSLHKSPGMLL